LSNDLSNPRSCVFVPGGLTSLQDPQILIKVKKKLFGFDAWGTTVGAFIVH